MSIVLRQYSRANDITVTEAQQKLEELLEFRPMSECSILGESAGLFEDHMIMNDVMGVIDDGREIQ